MDRNDLRTHLNGAVSGARPGGRLGLTARLIAYCWPGGPEDRWVAAGAEWVREWGPRRSGAAVPVCTCASGFCDICN